MTFIFSHIFSHVFEKPRGCMTVFYVVVFRIRILARKWIYFRAERIKNKIGLDK